MTAFDEWVALSPLFLGAVCRRSLRIVSVVAPVPVMVRIHGRSLHLRRSGLTTGAVKVEVVLSALRRGFELQRFPRFTESQRLANARFYADAHA